MALLHRAELRPSKIELVAGWAPTQPWFEAGTDPATGDAADLANVAAFRFDDPAGEVGVETLLVRAGDGPVLQVPLTYRGAPLAGGEARLIGTMQHSVLGQRWVYDGAGDPVYLTAVATAALTGGRQADLYVHVDGELVRREPTALVVGSGTDGSPVPGAVPADAIEVRSEGGSTVVQAGDLHLVIVRTLHTGARHTDADNAPSGLLSGTWSDQIEPVPLVVVLAP
ncbi:MAG TPA: hypothetical protein VGK17_16120 [Propionicimonas sp.]